MNGTDPEITQRLALGIDVGGSGVKGAIVDLSTGQLASERFRLETPQPATPPAVTSTIAEVVRHFGWTGPVGVTYPGVVVNGVVQTAANVDSSWIGTNATESISAALNGQKVTVLNDADAAGLAEQHYGAGRNHNGVIVLLTFGTGIGSAVIHDGKLAQHRVRPYRGGWKGSRTPGRVFGEGAQGMELPPLVQGGHQGSHRYRERDLARPVHRRWRYQQERRQVDSVVEEPHSGGSGRSPQQRRNRRRRNGQPTRSVVSVACAIAGSRYNGTRPPA